MCKGMEHLYSDNIDLHIFVSYIKTLQLNLEVELHQYNKRSSFITVIYDVKYTRYLDFISKH